MRTVALLYHDVVHGEDFDSSGFPGGDANIYKLTRSRFESHLDALARVRSKFLITVDDGGVSAIDVIAPMLEERAMTGYFFIPTNWIDRPGFLSKDQVRQLRHRGHLIGSHSCSHPQRISRCSWDQMRDEWQRSIDVLTGILLEPVRMASVPGGFYSRRVAEAAALSGIRTLFTSEPVSSGSRVAGCAVAGRYMIRQSTSAQTAAALARRDALPCASQYMAWNTKKILKRAGGTAWLRFRKWALAESRPGSS